MKLVVPVLIIQEIDNLQCIVFFPTGGANAFNDGSKEGIVIADPVVAAENHQGNGSLRGVALAGLPEAVFLGQRKHLRSGFLADPLAPIQGQGDGRGGNVQLGSNFFRSHRQFSKLHIFALIILQKLNFVNLLVKY